MLYMKCINSDELFNDYTECNSVDEEIASREVCNGIEVGLDDMYCCYVTYIDKHTDSVKNRCRLIEITEDALNRYKHTLEMHTEVQILCESRFHSKYILYALTVLIFLLI